MTLRDRCKKFLDAQKMRAMTRVGSPVQDLLEFVNSEVGRKADPSLEMASALVLYFGSPEERAAFIAMWHEANPGAKLRELP